MATTARVLLLATVVTVAGHAISVSAAPVKVVCSATKKVQTAINSAKAGVPTTIQVSGVCNENLVVPAGKTITLTGTLAGSKIAALNGSEPAVRTFGFTTIQNIVLENASGSADSVVEANLGGVLRLIGDSLSGPNVEAVVGIWDQSAAYVINSRIGSGYANAVDATNHGSLWMGATPGQPSGPDGAKTTLEGSLSCGPGSVILIRVKSANGQDGQLSISGGNNGGVFANGCNLSLWNKTTPVENLTISGNDGPGIHVEQSTLQLFHATVSNNQGPGLRAHAGTATVLSSAFSGNGEEDLVSGPGSSLIVESWAGANSFADAFSNQEMTCWPDTTGGHVFVDRSGMTVPVGNVIGDLTSNNPCITPTD